MSIEQVAAEALRLSPRERALLAESLWESLGDPFRSAESTEDEDTRLALARAREMEAGTVQAVSHEQMMARLRK